MPRKKAKAEELLKAIILAKLKELPASQVVMLKLTLPEVDDFYAGFISHPNVVKVVALSGGSMLEEARKRLRRNHGIVANVSRALVEGLSAQQSGAKQSLRAWKQRSPMREGARDLRAERGQNDDHLG